MAHLAKETSESAANFSMTTCNKSSIGFVNYRTSSGKTNGMASDRSC